MVIRPALLRVGAQRGRGARVGQQPPLEEDHVANIVDHPDLDRVEVLIDDVTSSV
jgi:hypothetical protein